MTLALRSAELHWWWGTACLYAKKVFIGVIAQACCEPVLQSSNEQWELHSALSSAAMH
jgi:hypothetical protein